MGKGVETRSAKRQTPARFSSSEIKEMEKLLLERKSEWFDESFYQKLTEELNCKPNRAKNKAIQVKQVESWFESRKKSATEAADSHNSSEELIQELVPVTDTSLSNYGDTSLSNNAVQESSDDMPGDTEEKRTELELEFEARSSRDNAWYDVDTFLAHRIIGSEPEVRVRYHNFGAEEDEWVNVKKNVRERSIPLESSECQMVKVGDLVLCFRERSDQAMYFDAHILNIERKLHDIRGCRCQFVVQYDHDQTEEKVGLKRMCRRPTY